MSSPIDQLQCKLERRELDLSDLLSLRNELRAPFKLHPLGFLACTLFVEGARKVRLHFWPLVGAIQQSSECQIHDHLFEFRSWVFSGAVENVEYIASPTGQEFAVYQAEYIGDCSKLTKTNSILQLSVRKRCTYGIGSSYEVPASVFHETKRVGTSPAFTVLVTSDVSTSAPVVLGPLDGSQSYMYEREVIDEDIVSAMLSGI